MLVRGVVRRDFRALGSSRSRDQMAPSFYHYLSVPMDEKFEEQGRRISRRWLAAAVSVLLVGVVLVTLLFFAVRANSEACRDGLRLQDECRNTTHLLQRQLTRAQDSLTQAETQANTCNRTVVRQETVPSNAPSDSEEALNRPCKFPLPYLLHFLLPARQLLMTLKSKETLELRAALKPGGSGPPFQDLGAL